MGSKFVTLGRKLLFWQQKWAAEIIFLGSKNYFFEQQEFIF
jgi:hypothetical protein